MVIFNTLCKNIVQGRGLLQTFLFVYIFDSR